jgi:hypothetical protein
MKKQKWLVLAITLVLIGSTGFFLNYFRSHQRLGVPGVKTKMLASGPNVEVVLPDRVLDYKSDPMEVAKIVLDMLPKDTCYGQRKYQATDGFETLMNVVLMGADRTSLHKPEFCLRGTGWSIDKSEETSVPMTQPFAYNLPVMKLTLSPEKPGDFGGSHGIYVYWFVADKEYTASHVQRMLWLGRDLFTTGVLQRWAYITCFAACQPGQEDATFERMKTFIAAAAPQFQLTPEPAPATTLSAR